MTPEPEQGLTPLIGLALIKKSFVSGDPESQRLRVRYFGRDDGTLVAKAWFGPGAEGPPGAAHGGSIAAVLDEAMGLACWMAGHSVVAAKIGVEFKHMLPLGTEARLEAWVESAQGRKVMARARLTGPDGKLFSESDGLFVTLEFERFEALRQS